VDGNTYLHFLDYCYMSTGFMSIMSCSYFDVGMTMLVKIPISSLLLDRDLKEELWVSTPVSVSTSVLSYVVL